MEKDDIDDSFPLTKMVHGDAETRVFQSEGAVRDWFAGMAMTSEIGREGLEGIDTSFVAECSYEMADAMLAARIKK